MKKVSIIVPVFNAENTIEKCLISICNQTYKNIEIIVINDGSTDNSQDIINQMGKEDNRIISVVQKNSGVSEARNLGLSIATGDYITFVDSDDYIESNMYEIMLNSCESSRADVVQCNYKRVDLNGKLLKSGNFPTGVYSGNDNVMNYFISLQDTVNHAVWNKLIKRKLIDSTKFPSYSYSEDYVFSTEIMKKVSKLIVIDEELYYYVDNPQSAVNQKFAKRRMDDTLAAGYIVFDTLKNDYPNLKVFAIVYILKNIRIWYSQLVKKDSDNSNELIVYILSLYKRLFDEYRIDIGRKFSSKTFYALSLFRVFPRVLNYFSNIYEKILSAKN